MGWAGGSPWAGGSAAQRSRAGRDAERADARSRYMQASASWARTRAVLKVACARGCSASRAPVCAGAGRAVARRLQRSHREAARQVGLPCCRSRVLSGRRLLAWHALFLVALATFHPTQPPHALHPLACCSRTDSNVSDVSGVGSPREAAAQQAAAAVRREATREGESLVAAGHTLRWLLGAATVACEQRCTLR